MDASEYQFTTAIDALSELMDRGNRDEAIGAMAESALRTQAAEIERLRGEVERLATRCNEMQIKILDDRQVGLMLERERDKARAALAWLIDQATRADLRVVVNRGTGFFVNRSPSWDRAGKRMAYAPPNESVEAAIHRAIAGEDPENEIREQIKKERTARTAAAAAAKGEGEGHGQG